MRFVSDHTNCTIKYQATTNTKKEQQKHPTSHRLLKNFTRIVEFKRGSHQQQIRATSFACDIVLSRKFALKEIISIYVLRIINQKLEELLPLECRQGRKSAKC